MIHVESNSLSFTIPNTKRLCKVGGMLNITFKNKLNYLTHWFCGSFFSTHLMFLSEKTQQKREKRRLCINDVVGFKPNLVTMCWRVPCLCARMCQLALIQVPHNHYETRRSFIQKNAGIKTNFFSRVGMCGYLSICESEYVPFKRLLCNLLVF